MHDRHPIIAKELRQLAASKQTYALRLIYLGIVSIFFYTAYHRITNFQSITMQLGTGHQLFCTLFYAQLALILCAVPPLVASAVTSERENGTIQLLMTLPMTDRSILLQKFVARLTPAITLIFLGMPLFGFAYILGGVSSDTIFYATAFSILAAMGAGAIALAISSTRKSSSSAIITSYLILFIPAAIAIPMMDLDSPNRPATLVITLIFVSITSGLSLLVALDFFRPVSLKQTVYQDIAPSQTAQAKRNVFTARHGLPRENAIVWLEQIKSDFTLKKSAVASAAMGLLLFFFSLVESDIYLLPLFMCMLGIGVAVFFRYQRAALQFRQNQLLPIVLTTPVNHREVIKQFFHGRLFVQRQSMMAVSILCLGGALGTFDAIYWLFSAVIIGAAWFYLRTLAWFAIGISFYTRTTLQAIGYGLGVVIFVVFILPNFSGYGITTYWNPLFFAFELVTGFDSDDLLLPVAIHYTCCTVVLLALRTLVIKNAPRLLLRAANKH